MKSQHIAVVGGGIAGLLSSLLLLQKGYFVTLIESSESTGGLLGRSYQWEDCLFDYGTHFLSSTGHDWADEILYGKNFEKTQDWIQVPVLRSGSYFAGRLNSDSQSLDIRGLPTDIYQAICTELLSREAITVPVSSLNDWVVQCFGEQMNEHVYAPMMRKFYGVSSDVLEPSAHLLLGLSRIILGSDFITQQIKKSPYFDNLISYQSREQGASKLKVFYPRTGVSEWVANLLTECQSYTNFNLTLNDRVDSLDTLAEGFELQLSTQDTAQVYAGLVWTAPLPLLGKLLGLPSEPMTGLTWRRGDLYHFVFDTPFLSDLYYVMCYQPDLHSYRITLYSNFNPGKAGYHCTVEVVRGFEEDTLPVELIEAELREMGLVQGKLIHSQVSVLKTGFPVNSILFGEQTAALASLLESHAPRLVLAGKNASRQFFMKDVINQVFDLLKDKEF
ncbi:MAG: NAD(P)-binding protein [Methyloprofundus sp.]|nr:NAD(P)-binding protein [Methyloprofundus sp.]